MEDYNRVLKATEVAENANGVAAEKMTVYNESLKAAQNRLTASIQQFAQDSNLDRILALAYDGLSKVVEILNILLNKIPVLSPLIKALGVALAAAFGAKMISSISAITSAIGSIGAAASSVGAILTTTAVTIGSFAVPVWGVVAAIAAIAGAIGLVVQASKDNTPEAKLEKFNQELEDGQGNLKDTQSQISEIDKKIKEIDDKGTLTLADEQEKTRLEEQRDVLEQILQYQKDINEEKLKEIKEEVSAQMGEKYTSGTIDSDAAYESKKRMRSGVGSSYAAASGSTTEYYNAENASVSELLANIRLLNEEQQELANTEGNHSQELSENNKLIQENINQLKQRATSIGEDISKMQELGLTNTQTYKDAVSQWNQLQVYLDPSNFEKLSISNLIDTSGIESKIKEAVQAGDKAGDEMATAYAKSFAEKILKDTSMKQSFADAMGININELNIDNLTQEILGKFQQMYNNISDGYNDVVQNVFSKTDVVSAYASILEKINDKTEVLSKAYKELTKQGSLTTDTTQKLIELYPDLAKQLDFTSGKITLNVEVLKDLYNAEYESAEATVKAEIEKTNATIAGVKSRIAALEAERQKLLQTLDAGILSGRDEAFAEKQMLLLEQSGSKANANLEEAEEHLKDLNSLLGLVQNTAKTGLGSGTKDSTSGSSSADKKFETDIKNRMKYLKGIVSQYALEDTWNDQATIDKYTSDWNDMLASVVDTPEARKIVADALGVDISKMSDEKAKEQLTKLLKEQYGDIQTEYKKLLKSKAKEDLNSAKAIINAYKEGVYGAWSSDEALNAAKADYQKFIDEITNNADYRAAMAEALNLGDISGESIEKQVEAVIKALLKSTGTLDDAQQDLYDDASKNIKALQDEIEDMIDTAIDLLEKAGDFLFDMLGKVSDRYDAQIDNLDKISDELDDQKDAFEDKIDQQKELLKLQKEEMDNADELAEKNKSIADIDAQLMELQYDDSAEAQAKRLKLLDERAEKEKDLADWQKDNDYNVKIDALDKEKSEYEKTIEAEKKAIEAQKQALQDAQKQFETTLGNIQNGFNTFTKILSSDLVKNLISKALINTGSDTVTNLLTGYNKLFGTGIDSDVTGTIKEAYKSLKDIGKNTSGTFGIGGLSKEINSTLDGVTKDSGKFLSGINSVIQPGIENIKGTFRGLKSTLADTFNLDWKGIGNVVQNGLQVVSTTFSSLFNPIAKGASAIGDAIGAGITGFFPGIFSALGTLITTVGGAMTAMIDAIAAALAAIPIAGWIAAAVAVAASVALIAAIAGTASKTANTKVTQPTQSFKAKKHHTGADYVKKENPTLDKMLGLNDDETVSILHVGEAVVPTWANNATPSSSSNRFTGSPFGSAVDTAVKSARANTRTYSSSDNSSINISMPINIQGDADASTVNSLKKEADNIVNKVLRTINNQTRLGGYKNIKAATV